MTNIATAIIPYVPTSTKPPTTNHHMTLKEFRRITADMPSHSKILVLGPWGDMEAAAIIRREDIQEGDPILEDLQPDTILIASDADIPLNIKLTPSSLATLNTAADA